MGKIPYADEWTHKTLLKRFHDIPMKAELAKYRPGIHMYRLYYSFLGKALTRKDAKKKEFDINASANANTFGAEIPPDIADDDDANGHQWESYA